MARFSKIVFVSICVLYVSVIYTQILDAASITEFELSGGTKVCIAKKVNSFDQYDEAYYYLPGNLSFSRSKENEPEFSFLTYKEGNEITGGILHFLIKWGLDKNQLQEADSIMKNIKNPEVVLMGAVMPEVSPESESFRVEGNSKIADILNNSKSTLGKTTVTPNSKIAASFHLTGNDALILQEAIKNNSQTLEEVFLVLTFILKFREPGSYKTLSTPYIIRENLKNLLNQ